MAGRRLLEDTAVSLSASAAASVLNYGQLVLCGRALDKGAFGAFGSLLALLWLGTILGNTLSLEVTRLVAGGSGPRAAVARVLDLAGRSSVRSRLAVAATLAASPALAQLLHTGTVEILATLAALGALLAGSVAQGVTTGLRRFRLQGGLVLGGALLKLVGTAALLAVSPGVLGALLGSALGYVFVAVGTLVAVGRAGSGAPDAGPPSASSPSPLDAHLAAAYFLSYAPFMVDQPVVQAIAPEIAGDYAALATLGKLVFHAVAPALAVLYPSLVAHCLEPRLQLRIFLLGTTLAVGLAGAAAALLSLRPEFVVSVLFSSRYAAAAPLLPTYAFGVVAFTLAHGVALLFLARGDRRMLSPLAATLLLQVGLLLGSHRSLGALSSRQVVAYCAMAGALVVRLALSERPGAARAGPPGGMPS